MDQALALKCSLVSQDARFEQLFGEHHSEIHVYLCRLVGDERQAEDLVQDTFAKSISSSGPVARGSECPGLAVFGTPMSLAGEQ